MSRSAPDSLHQKEIGMAKAKEAAALRLDRLDTPTDLSPNAVTEISGALNILLADMFALYLKTKNFHWHVSGPHFRDYHLLLDEQGEQIFATTDDIAERVRKIGGVTLRSIGHIGRLQRVLDNDADFVTPLDMLAELRDDSKQLVASLREIVLVNRTRKTAEAVATDMRYGTPLGPKVDIVDGDYDALKGAGIVLITAGVNHGCEGDFGKEVCCEAERRGTRTA